jgi:CRP-like cAMP-binding protein
MEVAELPDFLQEKRTEIQARIKELRPLVTEYDRLAAAEKALSAVPGNGSRRPRPGTSDSRPRSGLSSSSRRRGRPKGSGTRAQQCLEKVRDRPGITIPELATAIGIKQNYLYRVMPQLADEGKVEKQGRGWHIKEPAPV